jgi:hypothetical protein
MYNAAIFGESVQRCCEVNIPLFFFTFQKIVAQFLILATPDDSLNPGLHPLVRCSDVPTILRPRTQNSPQSHIHNSEAHAVSKRIRRLDEPKCICRFSVSSIPSRGGWLGRVPALP